MEIITAGEDGEVLQSYRPESLATTLNRVVEHTKRFVFHPETSTYDLTALWVAHSHAMPVWDSTPRLYVTAPQPGCGKTTVAKVMQDLCPQSLRVASVSGPGLFSAIEEGRPTLFLDEAENQFSPAGGRDKEVVTAVINEGYEPGGYVVRKVGGQSKRYGVYAPVCIVGIDNGHVPDATRSRCIPVQMRPGGGTERYRARQHTAFGDEVRYRLGEAALDWTITESPFNMRQGDLWEPLYSVAAMAGGDWPDRVRRAAEHHTWDVEAATSARMLRATHDYFAANDVSRVQSSVLARYLTGYDDLPTLTPKSLAGLMGGYGIRPHKRSESYYHRADFESVWNLWL